MSPSIKASSTPVTVTDCGVFQLLGVNVRLVELSVPSVESTPLKVISTSPLGWLASTTVKLADEPSSPVVTLAGLTTIPLVSLFLLLTSLFYFMSLHPLTLPVYQML